LPSICEASAAKIDFAVAPLPAASSLELTTSETLPSFAEAMTMTPLGHFERIEFASSRPSTPSSPRVRSAM
jgi:hypothetical protein